MKSHDQIQALADKVRERVDHYDSKAAPKDAYAGKEQIGFFAMTMRFASAGDVILFGITLVAILIYGSAQPFFSVLFGASSDTVNAAG